MKKFNIGYSTKKIPLPSRNDYLQRLIEKTEQFLRKLRWKAYFFFLNPDTAPSSKKTYGFKSTKNPPPVEELDFEDGMLKMVNYVKLKQVNNSFLNKLTDDTELIRNEPKLLIAAGKTTNITNRTRKQNLKLARHLRASSKLSKCSSFAAPAPQHKLRTLPRRRTSHY